MTTAPKPLSKTALMTKLKALGEITTEQRNSIVCRLIGHSKIVTLCFGYVNCARCEDQIGDTLGGSTELKENVVVGHDCPTCRENFSKLGWKDKLYAKNAFPKANA